MTVRLPQAGLAEAAQALLFITGWWGGWMPVRLGSWEAEAEVCWRRGPASDLGGLVRWLDEEHDDEVLLGLPYNAIDAGGVAQTSVLWARIEGTQQLHWARRFRPLPSLILQEGTSSRRVLMWALEGRVSWGSALRLNKRLAYKFGAVQKWADPDRLVIAAPGTCLRADRSRPIPVRVSRLTTESFHPGVFERHRWLKDPPEQTWMNG